MWSGLQRVKLVNSETIIIKGLTKAGKTFRPSDWADRLAGVMSTMGPDHRMAYSPFVKPMTINGVKCVVVNKRLKEQDPMAFNFMMNFAQDNDLLVEDASQFEEAPAA